MTTHGTNAYRTVTALTADPVTLTTMLYEGAIKALKKAEIHANSGDRSRMATESERAYLIIGELLATLDRSQGEIADGLAAVYGYCLRCITESALGDVSKLSEAEKHISRIAEAWKSATAALRMANAEGGRVATAA
jgi:flagellar secretion chaperone FliS